MKQLFRNVLQVKFLRNLTQNGVRYVGNYFFLTTSGSADSFRLQQQQGCETTCRQSLGVTDVSVLVQPERFRFVVERESLYVVQVIYDLGIRWKLKGRL